MEVWEGGLDSVQRPGIGGDTEGAPGLAGAEAEAEAPSLTRAVPPHI